MDENEIWKSIIETIFDTERLEFEIFQNCHVLTVKDGERQEAFSGESWKEVIRKTKFYKMLIIQAITNQTDSWSKKLNEAQWEELSKSAEIFLETYSK